MSDRLRVAAQKKLSELAKKELARRFFWYFCLWYDYKFFKKRVKVLKPIAFDLQMLSDDELDIYVGAFPPRTGKSYLLSLYIAWDMGNNPTESYMRNTYGASLADKFSNDVKAIVKNKKWTSLFGTKEFTKDATHDWQFKESEHGVTYFCGGVNGPITGFGCTRIAALDDAIKNMEEALSETILEKKWQWYVSTHLSRMEKGCKEIHMSTRWSPDDVVGKLLENKERLKGKRIKVVSQPALIIDEVTGEERSFCEDVRSTEDYQGLRDITDDIVWDAVFDQKPVEAKGRLFPKDELKYFKKEQLRGTRPDAVVAVGDIADEGDDYYSMPVGFVYGWDVYIVKVIFTQDKIENTQPRSAELLDRLKVNSCRFESNNGGKGYALAVKDLKQGNTSIDWKPTSTNKHTKIIMNSGQIKSNFYFLVEEERDRDYQRFMKQLFKYLRNGKAKHDDAPDSLAMLNEFLNGPQVDVA